MKADKWYNQLPFITDVHQEEIDLNQPFEYIAAGFAPDKGTVLLLSGSDIDCSRYHILGVDPWLEVKSFQDTIQIRYGKNTVSFRDDVFDVLKKLLNRFSLPPDKIKKGVPVSCGLFGYLSYDLKDRIEELPQTCMGRHLPDLYLVAPSLILVQDRLSRESVLCMPDVVWPGSECDCGRTRSLIKKDWWSKTDQPFEKKAFSIDKTGLVSSFSKKAYIKAVNSIIRYLKAGDIYQANFSQRFESGFSGDTYSLFIDLFERNPASFFSYINAGDHVIVSTSPERFIKQRGRKVETRPIKGTIARSKDDQQDRQNRKQLSASSKDEAELTMIVDLMRNDLSRVTLHDSVVVTDHKRIEPYENVYHLVSIVEGELEPGKTSIDLIRATFPGGSITGCPKIRSMEIIDELEPVKRHVYTGSIGYISFHDTMDLSIAIRTATITEGRIYFSVGGGIVYDSDPQKEFQETLDKGKTLIDALSGNHSHSAAKPVKVWANGKICNTDDVSVSVSSEGFQYGAGVFETIKVSDGKVFFLDDHVDRMNRGWQAITGQKAPDLTWKEVINLLLRENGLENQTAAVKLMLSKGEPGTGVPFAAALIRPYTHRLAVLNKEGLDLVVYPHVRHTRLADHKTMNYLFYEQAGSYAARLGADEALILNADQTLSETNTANIIAVRDKTVIVPASEHVLEGVTLQRSLAFLKMQGYDIKKEPVLEKEIQNLSDLIVTNSLMGAVKVMTINGRKVVHQTGVCELINAHLFGKQI